MNAQQLLSRGAVIVLLLACGICALAADKPAQQPLQVLVTGRGAGPGAIEEMWRPLVDDFGMQISVAFTVHVNSYYAEHGGEAYAGILPREQEQKMIELLVPPEGKRAVDVAIVGGRISAGTDQYNDFDRVKETWHPGTLSPALQDALVKYVKAGGKLIFSTRQVFTETRVTGKHVYKWEGGPLAEILPTNELKENLPFMDGRPREQWGKVSYLQIGDGKVIVVDLHTPSPTVAETKRKEFELWDVLVRWMARGNAEFPVTAAVELPSRKASAGSPLAARVMIRNYECKEAITLRLSVPGEPKELFAREIPQKVEPGQSRVEAVEIPVPNTWLTGRYALAVQLSAGKKLVASLAEPFDVAGVLDLSIKTDKDGYAEPNVPVKAAVEIRNNLGREYKGLRLQASFRDTAGRAFEERTADLSLAATPTQAAEFTFTMKDFPRGVYWVDVSVLSREECWARSSTPVYRYAKYDPDEEIIWTMWTFDHAKQWLDLYRDTGLNAICDDLGAAERAGLKVWTRSMYTLAQSEALPDDQLRAKFVESYAKPFAGRRDPAAWHPALAMVCQDGENGWPILLRGQAQKAPFTEWLKKQYPSLDALNASWGKTYKTWDEIEFGEPNSGYGIFPPKDAQNVIPYNDQQAWIIDQQFRYHQVWTEALQQASPYGIGTSATACAWSHNAGTSVIDLQCAQPWISTTDWFWQATRGRALFGNQHGRSTHWAFIANRPVLSTAFWGAIAAGSRFVDMWTPVFPERTRYPSWDGTFNIYRPSCKHSPASLDIKALIEQISRKQRVLLDARNVVSDSVAYWESSRGAAQEFGLFGHVFHSGFLPNLESGPNADLRKYKVVLATGANQITPAGAKLLKDFVAGGGFLVTFPGFATADEHGKPFDTAPGLGLDGVVGLKFKNDPQRKPGSHIVVKGQMGLPPDTRVAVWADASVQGGISDPAPALGVLAEYEGGREPALTFHKFGEGRAVHVNFGVQCGPAYAGQNRFVCRDESWEETRRLVERLLEWGKASRPFVLLDPEGRGVPQVNASMLATADASVRYLVAYSDYRQEHSLALDRDAFNGAAEKVAIPAAELREQNATHADANTVVLQGKDSYAEGAIKVPAAGRYQLWLDVYFEPPAEKQPNALAISIDGKNDPADNASGPERLEFGNTPITGRWLWQSGRWFELAKGKHTLRLTALGAAVRVRNVLLISPPALATRVYLAEKPAHVFDVYAEKEVKLAQDDRGSYIPLNLQPGEGRVLSLLPGAPGKLAVSIGVSKAVLGEPVVVNVSKDTPGTHSLRLTVLAPDKQEIRALRREFPLRDKAAVTLFSALNDPAGTWIVLAEDETTGQRAETKIKMKQN